MEKQLAAYERLLEEEMTFYDATLGRPVTHTGHLVVAFDHDGDVIAEYSGALDPVTGTIPTSVQYLGVYVPGTNTTMLSFDGQVRYSEYFVKQGYPQGSVGMITWKGGAFPQWGEAALGSMTQGLGADLARFSTGVDGLHSATVTGVGYSAGGSILGSAEASGMRLDRSLQVSSAGAGHNVGGVEDYPNTANVPHFSMMAPNDPLLYSQQLEAGDLGHGASPLYDEGFTRIETGYQVAEDPSSGQITGHHDVWTKGGTAMNQMLKVITGRDVEAYAEPQWQAPPSYGYGSYSNPIMEDGYRPTMIDTNGKP